MIKMLLVAVLFFLGQASVYSNRPDAIRCGADHSCCDGAMYIAHSIGINQNSTYCQVYNGEHRCVAFEADGRYHSGSGHYDSRRGCQNKTIATLIKENRTFDFVQSSNNVSISLREEINVLRNQIEAIKKKQIFANFWDYEQIKEKWKKEFKQQVLSEIKSKWHG